MKTVFPFCLLLLLFTEMNAQRPHYITGGQVYYTYQGMQNGEHVYRVLFQCYKTCPGGHVPRAIVSIYDRVTNLPVKRVQASLSNVSEMKAGDPLNDCLANPSAVCYSEATYVTDISLPTSVNGYTIACGLGEVYRKEGITNLAEWSYVLATYTAEIPGGAAAANSSPSISGGDLTVNCENSSFSSNFGAFDYDGDELRYYLCDAYRGGLNADNYIDYAAPPPFKPVIYASNFSGSRPLGSNVMVDEKLGILKGIAPGKGTYLVCVCIGEYRNGVLIATQRREFQIDITSCQAAKASLLPEYLLCKDNNTLQLSNLSSGFRVEAFNWQIFSSSGAVLFTDNKPTVSYTFADTGIYNVKLVINKGANPCIDSTTSIVKVYPGLKPDFIFSGDCVGKPTAFTNTSTATLGQINYWKWDFGDGGAWGNAAYSWPDVTGEFNPTYQYRSYGPSTVQLVVGTTYGCRDTLRRTINILSKPPLNIIYKDRLICLGDTTELWAFASRGGNFSWSPQVNMVNGNTPKPLVSPTVTTVYHVLLDDNGCQNTDSVKVRVTDKVFVQAMNDTTICQGDAIELKLMSDAHTYSWTNVSPENAALRNPRVVTTATTDYVVTASIGGCSAKDTIRVVTVPYPRVNAGADIVICDQTSAQLSGSADGSSFSWSPASTLNASNVLDPVAQPKQTTHYVLTAYDTRGCPKPASDTVLVTVLPPIRPFAGRDTTALVGMPMQLKASGGVAYEWSPATGLSATNVRNPIALYNSPSEGIKYKVKILNEAGCADSAYITVKVSALKPQVYVPTAFTPNGDGKNDVLRPIAAGIRIEYFQVYNRWGQLVFSTRTAGEGWDGTVGGKIQTNDVFTWVAKAVDETGKSFVQKGTVTLIR
ncbi:MAG: gliding motility-associated C-terminal domain-containing protein [Flavisolibacter sp.]|nr:gliding motility-associated C-terminal domain-containing protein [Flavisolibacter sp.]